MIRVILMMSVVFSISGCATLVNRFGMTVAERCSDSDSYVYGGVSLGSETVAEGFESGSPAKVGLAILDMPFSLLLDTFMLPFSIPEEMKRRERCKESGRE